MKKWFSFGQRNSSSEQAVREAIQQRDRKKLEQLLHQPPAWLANWSGLAACLKDETTDLLAVLLKAGANPNVSISGPGSYLMVTVLENQLAAAACLLQHGAKPNQADVMGAMPLMNAVKQSSEKMVQLLLKYGAEVEARDSEGETALMYAVAGNSEAVIQHLLTAGANPLSRNFDGLSALDRAYRPELIALLES